MKLSAWKLARRWGVTEQTAKSYLSSLGIKRYAVLDDNAETIEAAILKNREQRGNPFGFKGSVHIESQQFTIKSIRKRKNNIFFRLVDSQDNHFDAAFFLFHSKKQVQSFIAQNKKSDTITIDGIRAKNDNRILIERIVQKDGEKIGRKGTDFHGIVKLWQQVKAQKRR